MADRGSGSGGGGSSGGGGKKRVRADGYNRRTAGQLAAAIVAFKRGLGPGVKRTAENRAALQAAGSEAKKIALELADNLPKLGKEIEETMESSGCPIMSNEEKRQFVETASYIIEMTLSPEEKEELGMVETQEGGKRGSRKFRVQRGGGFLGSIQKIIQAMCGRAGDLATATGEAANANANAAAAAIRPAGGADRAAVNSCFSNMFGSFELFSAVGLVAFGADPSTKLATSLLNTVAASLPDFTTVLANTYGGVIAQLGLVGAGANLLSKIYFLLALVSLTMKIRRYIRDGLGFGGGGAGPIEQALNARLFGAWGQAQRLAGNAQAGAAAAAAGAQTAANVARRTAVALTPAAQAATAAAQTAAQYGYAAGAGAAGAAAAGGRGLASLGRAAGSGLLTAGRAAGAGASAAASAAAAGYRYAAGPPTSYLLPPPPSSTTARTRPPPPPPPPAGGMRFLLAPPPSSVATTGRAPRVSYFSSLSGLFARRPAVAPVALTPTQARRSYADLLKIAYASLLGRGAAAVAATDPSRRGGGGGSSSAAAAAAALAATTEVPEAAIQAAVDAAFPRGGGGAGAGGGGGEGAAEALLQHAVANVAVEEQGGAEGANAAEEGGAGAAAAAAAAGGGGGGGGAAAAAAAAEEAELDELLQAASQEAGEAVQESYSQPRENVGNQRRSRRRRSNRKRSTRRY
jgi:hypothetical protein